MLFLLKLASRWAWPRWAAALFGYAVPVLGAAALLGGIYGWIERRGERKGAAKVEAKAETAHARTVAEARSDSARAQATVDAIGKRVAKADDQTSILVRSKIMEIHDALDATPGAAAGNDAAAAPFDTDGVRASLNALVDGANGAADAADAER
ncbi:MAG TPA: hypothetical protein VF409_08905 [Sphingomonas sp.]